MSAHSLRLPTICLLTLILAPPSHAQDPTIPSDFVSKADILIQRYVDDGRFQGVVLLKSAGVTLLRKAYGWGNVEWSVPITPEAKFRIGSITKQFTAAAILQLEEEGQLSVGDRITRFYPEAPAGWSNITIENLLRHTSGIFDVTELPSWQPRLPLGPGGLVAAVHDRPLGFEPGTKYSYCNTGYLLLGLIIERVSGLSWAEYTRRNVLEKAGLRDTGYDRTERILAQRAAGYRGDGMHLINADFLDMTNPHAAGALYSTADDLSRWFEALEGGLVISPGSFKRMTTPGLGQYGYGLGIAQFNGTTLYAHGGGIDGFATAIMRLPIPRFTAVVLSNIETAPSWELQDLLGQLALGRNPAVPPLRVAIPLPNEALDAIVGRYRLPNDTIVTVTRDEEVLLYERSVPMWAQSESAFFSRTLPLEFLIQRQGENITGIVIKQGNTNTLATRVP